MSILKKILKWVGIVIAAGFVVLVIVRMFVLDAKEKTAERGVRIHATKLTLDDVVGKNLPPEPKKEEADKTVQGIDANENGIRDDVELAIFKEYPNSAKTRAVLLQYALIQQTQMTLPTVNTETVTATVEDKSRAELCMWTLSSRSDLKKFLADMESYRNFVTERQINTEERKKYKKDFYDQLGSYSASHESCDLDISALPN